MRSTVLLAESGSEGGNCGTVLVFELKNCATKCKQNWKGEAYFLPREVRHFSQNNSY
jgi:hypothetical protein